MHAASYLGEPRNVNKYVLDTHRTISMDHIFNTGIIDYLLPLHSACKEGNLEKVIDLVGVKKIAPNLRNKKGFTELYYVCEYH